MIGLDKASLIYLLILLLTFTYLGTREESSELSLVATLRFEDTELVSNVFLDGHLTKKQEHKLFFS